MNLERGIPEQLRRMQEWDNIIDASAEVIAKLIDGKLENVSNYRLRRLKRQLQNFNSTTGRWKP